MSRDDDTLLKLATAIVDGKAIGWEKAEEQAVTDQGRALFRQMRVLAEVERMSRELDPATWGHLEIREKVGEGTFGDVYRAWDPTLARDVALKLFKSTVVSAPGQADFANDVLKEGQLLARVQHPNVTAVYGAGIHDGRVGLWMELIRGRSLDQIVQEHGAMGAAEAVNIGLELCRALAAVHGQGLVHGDIKARNVMREDRGRIVLMDFGAGRDRRRANDTLRTLPHGTLCYMAPELLRGEEASPQSDIYSL